MPAWLRALAPLIRRVPWRRVRWDLVYEAGKWLTRHGRERLENLSEKERRDLIQLLRKSKGRRKNLSVNERRRLQDTVVKALRGPDRK